MAARIMMAFLEVGNGQRTGRENQGQVINSFLLK
jgi:hypothetical protein